MLLPAILCGQALQHKQVEQRCVKAVDIACECSRVFGSLVQCIIECTEQHTQSSMVSFSLQVDAAEDMWGSAGAGRSAGGSKMLLEDADADEDDLVVGLGAAAGAAADFMAAGSDTGGATAMDAGS
jgi:hypothetical protein